MSEKMSKNKLAKIEVVADIVEKLKNAQSVTICSYSGLTVEQVTELRKLCRAEEVAYVVLKNRLVLRALNEVGITGLDDLLNGPNAFVFSMKDAVAGPRVINDYIEKNKLQSLKITGGILEGKAIDVATVKALANLPSREVLLAKLLGCMSNTVASFVRVVDAYRKKLAGEE
jgi:large subunit ribosomal protein L10